MTIEVMCKMTFCVHWSNHRCLSTEITIGNDKQCWSFISEVGGTHEG
jgi:hypothetical protein